MEAKTDLLQPLDGAAAVVVDFQVLRHHRIRRSCHAEQDDWSGNRSDHIDRWRDRSDIWEDLLGGERQEKQRGNDPCTKFQHHWDKKTPAG